MSTRSMTARSQGRSANQPLSQSLAVNEVNHNQYRSRRRLIRAPSRHLLTQFMVEEKTGENVKEERQVLPALEELKTIPSSLEDLCHQLYTRIQEQPALHCSLLEDQHTLLEVMSSELGLIWQDLKGYMYDPFLTQTENRQLQSRTVAEVLRLSQQLFLSYLHLLDTLRRRSVFSDQANRSRLAAQMASDCTNCLNVHSIRRNVASVIKATRRKELTGERCSDPDTLKEEQQEELSRPPLKIDTGLHQARARSLKSGVPRHSKDIEKDIKYMIEKMGDLDLELAYNLMPCHLEVITNRGDGHSDSTALAGLPSIISSLSKSEGSPRWDCCYTRLKGCRSMPDLWRDTLLDELEMDPLSPRPPSPLVRLDLGSQSKHLRRLLQDKVSEAVTDPDEADLPALIKAMPWRGPSKMKHLPEALQSLEEKQERRARKRLSIQQPTHPQGSSVNVPVSLPCSEPQLQTLVQDQIPQDTHNQFQGSVAMTAAARISDRLVADTIHIHKYPPVYNDLTKELEIDSVQWLDHNLFIGEDIKEVFKELSKSVSTQYLNFDEDGIFEPVMLTKTRFNLKKKNLEKLINPELMRPNVSGVSHRKRLEIPTDHKHPRDPSSRAYAAWLQWRKSDLSQDDYLRYISNQDSDYLGAVFHLYNSSDNDDEEDEKQNVLHLQLVERKREKIEALKRKKQEYVTGLWNVNTVLLGGLWKEPVLEEEETDPDQQITPVYEQAKKSAVWSWNEGEGPLDVDRLQRSRLEKIWNVLCLPDAHRLDMTIKYSSHAYRNQLEEATAAWECAARLIQQREMLLGRFELFERDASDPDRFFQRGYNGTSLARMVESRKRIELESHLTALETKLSEILSHIAHNFHDTVTYKGRPYGQKMRCDRVEMLYWLQQQRRVQSLHRVVLENRGSHPIRLPSLVANLREYPGSGTHSTPQGVPWQRHPPDPSGKQPCSRSEFCSPTPAYQY